MIHNHGRIGNLTKEMQSLIYRIAASELVNGRDIVLRECSDEELQFAFWGGTQREHIIPEDITGEIISETFGVSCVQDRHLFTIK